MSRLLNGLWSSSPAGKMVPPSAHPYYPLDAHVPGYEANGLQVIELLTLFALGCSVIFAVTWFVLGKTSPRLPMKEKMIVLWFMLSTGGSDLRMAITDNEQAEPYMFSLKDTSCGITRPWAASRISSASCGRNTLSQIHDT
jgi:hypothetical protein